MNANRPVLIFSGIRKLWNVTICVFHTIYTYCMWKSVWKAYKTLQFFWTPSRSCQTHMCTCHVLKCQLMGVIIKKLNIKITTIYWFYNNIQLHIIFVLVELGCPKGCMFRQLKKIIIIQTFIMFLLYFTYRRQQKHMGICHSWNCRGSLHFANPCNRSFHRNRIGKGS